MTKDIGKPTLAEKQAFWSEQLPLFKGAYWLPEHFQLLEFDMEAGNFVVRDDIDQDFKDDADDLYHRINTGWSMWKRAVNHMQKKLEGCVVVPLNNTTIVAVEKMVEQQVEASGITADVFRLDGEKILNAAVEAARGGNHD